MNNKAKYDPEDIEQLLRDKKYIELCDEEREFVNMHIGSEHEYTKLRSLLAIVEDQSWDNTQTPSPELRTTLIENHHNKHKKSIRIWLNNLLFASDGRPWHKQRVVQWTLAAGLIAGVILSLPNNNAENKTLAETMIEDTPIQDTRKPSPLTSKDMANESETTPTVERNINSELADAVSGNSEEVLLEPSHHANDGIDKRSRGVIDNVDDDVISRQWTALNNKDTKKSPENSLETDKIVTDNLNYEDVDDVARDKEIVEYEPVQQTQTQPVTSVSEIIISEMPREELERKQSIQSGATDLMKKEGNTSGYHDNKSSDNERNISISLSEMDDVISKLFVAY